jgi:predicted metal-binding transcription factor (methanogenesis marker protein 9)
VINDAADAEDVDDEVFEREEAEAAMVAMLEAWSNACSASSTWASTIDKSVARDETVRAADESAKNVCAMEGA